MNVLTCYCLAACLALSGCSSVMSHTGPDMGYYPGTRASVTILADEQTNWIIKPLALLDLPFSALLDTLLLPWDCIRNNENPEDKSPRARILRSEQQAQSQQYPERDDHSAIPLQ